MQKVDLRLTAFTAVREAPQTDEKNKKGPEGPLSLRFDDA